MTDQDTASSPKRIKLDPEADQLSATSLDESKKSVSKPSIETVASDTSTDVQKKQNMSELSHHAQTPEKAESENPSETIEAAETNNTPAEKGDTVATEASSRKSSDDTACTTSEKGSSETHCKDTDVGITEYISTHEGFTGILKQRYSDFLVNEIRQDGSVVQLTNSDLPNPEEENTASESQTPEVDPALKDILDADVLGQLKDLTETKDQDKSVLIKIGKVGGDKSIRGKLHTWISRMFPGLDSTTVTRDDDKFIQVKLSSNKDRGFRRWPQTRGNYCKFVLYKENKGTMDTVSLIAKLLHVKSGLFQYAGTKDKRAKTSQEVTAYRISAEKLLENNSRLRGNIVTGNYCYVKQPFKLGQLLGNRFTIVLRAVTGSEAQVEAAMTSLKERGFINYYGMQRFGTSTVPTHHIGRALLQSNWKEAIQLILKPRDKEDERVTKARQIWWDTGNCRDALSCFPHRCFIERSILEGLMRNKDNYLGAMSKIPRNTRLMYVHSYQSYVWNSMVSHRLREFGLEPVIGDLVLPRDSMTVEDIEDMPDSNLEGTFRAVPHLVTKENIDQYSIEDVVLPLAGYDVIYPENKMKDKYRQMMTQDSLDLDKMRHKTKDFSLSGAYRHIVIRPKDVVWHMCSYDNIEMPLVLSDLDRLRGEPVPELIQGGSKQALVMELTLPSSCYATMAIREILKTDTSASHMTNLNVT